MNAGSISLAAIVERRQRGGSRRRGKDRLQGGNKTPPLAPRRNRPIDLLGRLNDVNAGKRGRYSRTRAFPGDGRAQEPAARDRRYIEGFAPAGRGKPGFAEQVGNLRSRIRPAVAERRRVHARPQAPSVRHHREQPSAAGQHAPYFAQQPNRVGRIFQRMHQQHAIDRRIGERQVVLLDQSGKRGLR